MYGVLDSFTDYPHGLPFLYIYKLYVVCLFVARNCNK